MHCEWYSNNWSVGFLTQGLQHRLRLQAFANQMQRISWNKICLTLIQVVCCNLHGFIMQVFLGRKDKMSNSCTLAVSREMTRLHHH